MIAPLRTNGLDNASAGVSQPALPPCPRFDFLQPLAALPDLNGWFNDIAASLLASNDEAAFEVHGGRRLSDTQFEFSPQSDAGQLILARLVPTGGFRHTDANQISWTYVVPDWQTTVAGQWTAIAVANNCLSDAICPQITRSDLELRKQWQERCIRDVLHWRRNDDIRESIETIRSWRQARAVACVVRRGGSKSRI